MDEETKKKNILDLEFQMHMNIISTAIVIIFTYLIGIGIALISNQINLKNYTILIFLLSCSLSILILCFGICLNSFYKIIKIPDKIKNF